MKIGKKLPPSFTKKVRETFFIYLSWSNRHSSDVLSYLSGALLNPCINGSFTSGGFKPL